MRNCSISSQCSVAVLLSSLVFVASGCGQSETWKAKTHPAFGVMKVDGKAAEGAIIMLWSTGNPVDRRDSHPWAMVSPDGTYQLTTYTSGDGAPEGEYKVMFYWPTTSESLEIAPDRLKGKYSSLESPYLKVAIVSGKNELPPIEVTTN